MTSLPEAEHRSLPKRFWAGLLVLPFAILLLLDFVGRAPAIDGRWRHDAAWALFSDSPSPPASSEWKYIAIPDMDRSDGRFISSTWYRFDVRIAAPTTEPWAVYILEPNSNIAAYVNGEYVGDGGSFTPPIAEHGAALYFEIPGALLHEGDNRIELRNVAQWPGTWMNTVYIGPSEPLHSAYSRVVLVRVLALHITTALAVVTGLIMALMFVLYRRETAFGWLALAIFAWVLHALAALLPQAPMNDRYAWIALTDAMLGWFVVFAMVFVHRFLGERRPRVEWVAIAWCASGTLLLLATATFFRRPVDDLVNWLWLPAVHVVSVYIIVKLIRAARTRPAFDVQLLLFAAVTGEVIGLRDFLVFSDLLPGSHTLYLNHAISLQLVAFGVVLLRRCVRALHETELLNRDLELMIARKTAESRDNLAKVMEIQRQQAVNAERERVMREVHEGLGGRLVEALALASSEPRLKPAEPMLRAILDELRLIVDAIEPADGDLLVVLGMLRSRMSKRVEACGVRIEWDVDDVPPLPDLSPHRVLQILRIVQEAISNALRHARATKLTIRTRLAPVKGQPAAVLIEVADDGAGIDATAPPGHGLRNMRHRAQQIGASLVVEKMATGTSVRLLLPLDTTRSTQCD